MKRALVWAGMMLAASPPWVTKPCTRAVGQEALAEQADGDLGDGQRIGGVDALLRVQPRRGPPCRCSAPRTCEAAIEGWVGGLVGRRVDHHRDVDVVEGAGRDEPLLAAVVADLLGRRAEDGHGQAEIVGQRRQRQPGADGRRRR